MAKCNYCGRESDSHEVKQVGGYYITLWILNCKGGKTWKLVYK